MPFPILVATHVYSLPFAVHHTHTRLRLVLRSLPCTVGLHYMRALLRTFAYTDYTVTYAHTHTGLITYRLLLLCRSACLVPALFTTFGSVQFVRFPFCHVRSRSAVTGCYGLPLPGSQFCVPPLRFTVYLLWFTTLRLPHTVYYAHACTLHRRSLLRSFPRFLLDYLHAFTYCRFATHTVLHLHWLHRTHVGSVTHWLFVRLPTLPVTVPPLRLRAHTTLHLLVLHSSARLRCLYTRVYPHYWLVHLYVYHTHSSYYRTACIYRICYGCYSLPVGYCVYTRSLRLRLLVYARIYRSAVVCTRLRTRGCTLRWFTTVTARLPHAAVTCRFAVLGSRAPGYTYLPTLPLVLPVTGYLHSAHYGLVAVSSRSGSPQFYRFGCCVYAFTVYGSYTLPRFVPLHHTVRGCATGLLPVVPGYADSAGWFCYCTWLLHTHCHTAPLPTLRPFTVYYVPGSGSRCVHFVYRLPPDSYHRFYLLDYLRLDYGLLLFGCTVALPAHTFTFWLRLGYATFTLRLPFTTHLPRLPLRFTVALLPAWLYLRTYVPPFWFCG